MSFINMLLCFSACKKEEAISSEINDHEEAPGKFV